MKVSIRDGRLTADAESHEEKVLFRELAELQACAVAPALVEMLMFFKARSRAMARRLPAGTVRIWGGGDGVIVVLGGRYAVMAWNDRAGWSEISEIPPGAMAVLRSLPDNARDAVTIS